MQLQKSKCRVRVRLTVEPAPARPPNLPREAARQGRAKGQTCSSRQPAGLCAARPCESSERRAAFVDNEHRPRHLKIASLALHSGGADAFCPYWTGRNGANCCLTRRCTLRGRVAQMSGAERGFASIRCMSIREATTADFRSESFHSRICHRIDPLSGPRPRIDYQWPF
jgi:hypothetical protein